MPANRIVSLGALWALVSGTLGCNSALGIHEKEQGNTLVDGGGFVLSIIKPPAQPDGSEPAVRLLRGSAASVDLAVGRSGGFEGTVTVLVSGLAQGVTAQPLILPPSQSEGTLTIHAADSAQLGPSSLSILGVHENLVPSPLELPLIVQDAPGTPDQTFGNGGKLVLPVGSGGVGPGGIQLQPNGSLVLCGHAKSEGVQSAIAVARITAAGALDPTFALGAGFALGNSAGSNADACAAMFLRPNGGIVFTGFATPLADQPRALMTARYRPDGFPDQNFGVPSGGFGTTPFDGTGSEGYCVVGPTVEDTFVVGGLARGRPALVRFNKNGQLDTTFGSENAQELSAQRGIRWLAQQASGNFVAPIESTTFLVARFLSNGALDKTFGDNGTKSVAVGDQGSSAAVVLAQPDDAVLAVGTQTIAAGATDIALARLTKSGQLDPAFGVAGVGTVHFNGASRVSSAVESDGAILIAGQTLIEAGPAFTVLRISGGGSLDTTFGTAGREVLGPGMAQAITVDDLGRIIVAGFSGSTSDGSLVVYRLWP